MRLNLFLAVLIITSLSCSKNKDDKTVVKYEVLGTSPEGYDAAYTNELGLTSNLRVFSGWTFEITGEKGKCYTLTIIPYLNCDSSGTINIYINNKLQASKFVLSFNETVPDPFGRPNCGISQTACN